VEKVQNHSGAVISIELIISNIKSTRDLLVKNLLNDQGISAFLENYFETFVISPVKKEFLRRDLKELQNSNLDLVHYAALIRQMKDESNYTPDPANCLFSEECIKIFRKYGF